MNPCVLRHSMECSCEATCKAPVDLGTFVKPERIVLSVSLRTQLILLAFAAVALVGSVAFAIPYFERQVLIEQEQVMR